MSSKQEIISEISEILTRYRKALELIKGWSLYDVNPDDWNNVHINYLREGLNWLKDGEPIWLEWRKIRKQQTEDRWAWYEADPETFHGFREVLLQKEALKHVRAYFYTKERPDLFKPKMLKKLEIKK